MNDGSRIIGKKIKRDGDVDIITKGVYSPCKSRIKISNFICPTWQLEGEKILHDNENLFLYQKHSKMRVLNTPVFYIPYIVSPSPLRKERKSGFLIPSISLNFLTLKHLNQLHFLIISILIKIRNFCLPQLLIMAAVLIHLKDLFLITIK